MLARLINEVSLSLARLGRFCGASSNFPPYSINSERRIIWKERERERERERCSLFVRSLPSVRSSKPDLLSLYRCIRGLAFRVVQIWDILIVCPCCLSLFVKCLLFLSKEYEFCDTPSPAALFHSLVSPWLSIYEVIFHITFIILIHSLFGEQSISDRGSARPRCSGTHGKRKGIQLTFFSPPQPKEALLAAQINNALA